MVDGIPGAVGFRFAVGGRPVHYFSSRFALGGILVAPRGNTALEVLYEVVKGRPLIFELPYGFFDFRA